MTACLHQLTIYSVANNDFDIRKNGQKPARDRFIPTIQFNGLVGNDVFFAVGQYRAGLVKIGFESGTA